MNTQLKKGVLEMLVLHKLQRTDRYGYELTESISETMEISTGTLYLVLKRLKDEGYVTTYLQESAEGPARKYYHLTEEGGKYLITLKKEWLTFSAQVTAILAIT